MPSLRSSFAVGLAISAVAGLIPAVAGAHIGQRELFTYRLAPGASLGSMSSRVAYEKRSAPPTQVLPDTELTPVQGASGAQSPRPDEPPLVPVPRAVCGPGAREETGIQGRISRADHESGLAAKGLRCNAVLVGQHTQEKAGQNGTVVGSVGGYKVIRYVDKYGNECAFYDTSLLPPTNVGDGNLGVRVLDMADPAKPALSTILTSPAMSFPHESLILSQKRGLLLAVAGNLSQTVLPGEVDIYDLNATPGLGCKAPLLLSSTPLGIWGHESGISPDGNTFYASSLSNETVTAVDISNPVVPKLIVHQQGVAAHGISISETATPPTSRGDRTTTASRSTTSRRSSTARPIRTWSTSPSSPGAR